MDILRVSSKSQELIIEPRYKLRIELFYSNKNLPLGRFF